VNTVSLVCLNSIMLLLKLQNIDLFDDDDAHRKVMSQPFIFRVGLGGV
jgi:hypothetical protein